MSQWSPTQIIILLIAAFIGIFATLVFAGIVPWFGKGADTFGGEVAVWGTFPERDIRPALEVFNETNEDEFTVVYVERSAVRFNDDLVEAIASGAGPDMVLLPQEFIVRQENKIFSIPFGSLSLRDFKDTFVELGELYVAPEGIVGLPLVIDPLALYWNRDLFSGSGIALPPKYWDELLIMAPRLSRVEEDTSTVNQSAVALGEFVNIVNAKEVLAALFLQTGDAIITRNEESTPEVVFGDFVSGGVSASESSLRFYTEFSNPSTRTYSWNRSLPEARRAFTGNKLALYFGFASEFDDIIAENSHLNFDVAKLPQIRGQAAEKTFGKSVAVSVLRSSDNIETAFRAAFAMIDPRFLSEFSKAVGMVPARRDMLAEAGGADPHIGVFQQSAIMSRGWLDPDHEATQQIFGNMVSGITSGRERESEAVSRASQDLQNLLDK